MSSQTIVQALREEGIYNRPLGNVIYLMCGPMTSPTKCSKLLCKLSQQLDAFMDSNGCSKSCPVMACQLENIKQLSFKLEVLDMNVNEDTVREKAFTLERQGLHC